MKKFSPGILPTLVTVPVVIILLALCVWQVNRYSWKINLIDTINSQLAAPAVEMPTGDLDPEKWQYRRVKLTGHYEHDKELHLFAHADPGREGFQIITPFVRSGNGEVVLVNRGWVPKNKVNPETRPAGQVRGDVTITGVIRKPWGKAYSFMPESSATDNVWLYGQLSKMADYLKMKVAPVFVELDANDVPGGLPIGGQTRITLPNNHIQYAFTWLGLAITMAIIFVIYGLKRGKGDEDAPE
ncbi:MAG: SURF1 family protein [Alphaproteobacteria bacterium]|nr:MAG: SURF1 family protein [Alphaproteobacteria bacterium]